MEDKEAKQCELELERRIYYLKTLYDLSLEIGYQRETHEIIKNLLLMMIGTFGASRGLIFLLDKTRRKIDALTQRGLTPDSINLLVQRVESEDPENFDKITDIHLFNEKGDLLSSFNLRIWIPFNIDANFRGGIGLGDKLSGDPYTPDDQELLLTMAHQGAVAIENAKLQQARIDALEQSKKELEQLNLAKSRALDHLSHELKTPLSVIQGNIRILKRKYQAQTSPTEGEKFFETLGKQLNRLIDIQQETDNIIRSYQELEGKFPQDPGEIKTIPLFPFLEGILEKVKQKAIHRDLRFQLEGTNDLCVAVDGRILEEALEGLLKNAVENTPDEGMIQMDLEQKDGRILVKVKDFGIGITEENQKLIFGGLFHTLETDLYTSKTPYDFGAGGKGLDLLRMKVYGQRYGFDLSVESQRCIYIPTDRDLCPGKISLCPHCKGPKDCYSSGGSTFCLSFPMTK